MRRGPAVVQVERRVSAQTRMAARFARVGATGLEPVPPTYDIGRHGAPSNDKRAANAALFTWKSRLLALGVASRRNGPWGAPWSKRGPNGAADSAGTAA